jgi:hypothetical protein
MIRVCSAVLHGALRQVGSSMVELPGVAPAAAAQEQQPIAKKQATEPVTG